jgi:hypothetical protein
LRIDSTIPKRTKEEQAEYEQNLFENQTKKAALLFRLLACSIL